MGRNGRNVSQTGEKLFWSTRLVLLDGSRAVDIVVVRERERDGKLDREARERRRDRRGKESKRLILFACQLCELFGIVGTVRF
jgi:hypothetical protein